MGQWNGTCAISQLPILRGAPVLLVLIQQSLYPDICESEGRDMRGGINSLWAPRALPIRGTYNGYGKIDVEDPGHWSVQLALHRFRLDVIERESGTRNATQEPEVKIKDILEGRELGGGMVPGIDWLQRLITKDRLRVRVPKWLDSETDREKVVSACLIRADIYDDLARHFTDDGHGNGRTPGFTRSQVKESLAGRKQALSGVDIDDSTTMNSFIKPRMTGSSQELMRRTRELLGGEETDLIDDEFVESIESIANRRLRDPPERFAEDYAAHLLGAGVEWDEQIDNIIEEIAAFIHVQLHMALLNKFWHPQPCGQDAGWLSHAAIAMRTIALAQAHSRQEPE